MPPALQKRYNPGTKPSDPCRPTAQRTSIADSVLIHLRMTPFPSEQVRLHLLNVYRIRRIYQKGPIPFQLFRHLGRPGRLTKKPLHDLPAYFRILIQNGRCRPQSHRERWKSSSDTTSRLGNGDQRLSSSKSMANRYDIDGLPAVPTGSPTVASPPIYRIRPVKRI